MTTVKLTNILCGLVLPSGSVATAEDPAAIATIQSAATFADQPIKYLFKTEGAGGQVGQRIEKIASLYQEELELTYSL